MQKYETYRCPICGNEVEVQNVGGGTLTCCDQPMSLTTQSLTQTNLLKAFAGESMARNKYEYFAKIAQKEGYRDIAEHFQRAADNEKSHAKLELKQYNLLHSQEAFGSTAQNLQSAIDGEHYESSSMYPDFAAIAKAEGHNGIAALFKNIAKIEVEHEKMYQELLDRLQSDHEFLSEDSQEEWVCEVCGHIHRGKKALDVCPVCNHPKSYQSRLNSKK